MKAKNKVIKKMGKDTCDVLGPRTPDPDWERHLAMLEKQRKEAELAQQIRETADIVMRWKDLEGILAAYIQPVLSQLSRLEDSLDKLKHDLVMHQAEQSVKLFRDKLNTLLSRSPQSTTLSTSLSTQKKIPSQTLRGLKEKTKGGKLKGTWTVTVKGKNKITSKGRNYAWKKPKDSIIAVQVHASGGSGGSLPEGPNRGNLRKLLEKTYGRKKKGRGKR